MAQQQQELQQADIDRAQASLDVALRGIDVLTKADLSELASMLRPPAKLLHVATAVLMMLGPDDRKNKKEEQRDEQFVASLLADVSGRTWTSFQRTFRGGDIMRKMREFSSVENFPSPYIRLAVSKIVAKNPESFDPAHMVKISRASAGLAQWVKCTLTYFDFMERFVMMNKNKNKNADAGGVVGSDPQSRQQEEEEEEKEELLQKRKSEEAKARALEKAARAGAEAARARVSSSSSSSSSASSSVPSHEEAINTDELQQALRDLAALSPAQFRELFAPLHPSRPPKVVVDSCAAALTLLGINDTSWKSARTFFFSSSGGSSSSCVDIIRNFTAERLPIQRRKQVEKMVADSPDAFRPEVIYKMSEVCAALSRWVLAMIDVSQLLETFNREYAATKAEIVLKQQKEEERAASEEQQKKKKKKEGNLPHRRSSTVRAGKPTKDGDDDAAVKTSEDTAHATAFDDDDDDDDDDGDDQTVEQNQTGSSKLNRVFVQRAAAKMIQRNWRVARAARQNQRMMREQLAAISPSFRKYEEAARNVAARAIQKGWRRAHGGGSGAAPPAASSGTDATTTSTGSLSSTSNNTATTQSAALNLAARAIQREWRRNNSRWRKSYSGSGGVAMMPSSSSSSSSALYSSVTLLDGNGQPVVAPAAAGPPEWLTDIAKRNGVVIPLEIAMRFVEHGFDHDSFLMLDDKLLTEPPLSIPLGQKLKLLKIIAAEIQRGASSSSGSSTTTSIANTSPPPTSSANSNNNNNSSSSSKNQSSRHQEVRASAVVQDDDEEDPAATALLARLKQRFHSSLIYDPKDLKIHHHEQLGRGGYGVVVEATVVATGRPLAAKIFDDVEDGISECERAAGLHHRGIVSLVGVSVVPSSAALRMKRRKDHIRRGVKQQQQQQQNSSNNNNQNNPADSASTPIMMMPSLPPPRMLMLMELAEGSLQHVLDCYVTKLEFDVILRFALQIAQALKWLHSRKPQKIFFLDLKPNNILCFNDFTQLKLCDFGTSRESTRTQTMRTMVVGSRGYIAPECYDSKVISTQVDVYAFGVILRFLITGLPPPLALEYEDVPVEEEQDVNASSPSPSSFAFEGNRAKNKNGDNIVVDDGDDGIRKKKQTRRVMVSLAKSVQPRDKLACPGWLLDLCKACLAIDPSERPKDGGAILNALVDGCAASSEQHQLVTGMASAVSSAFDHQSSGSGNNNDDNAAGQGATSTEGSASTGVTQRTQMWEYDSSSNF